jgi:hypothetical protein
MSHPPSIYISLSHTHTLTHTHKHVYALVYEDEHLKSESRLRVHNITTMSCCSSQIHLVTAFPAGEVKLRPTVSRPVCLGVGLPSGTHDQNFFFCLTVAGFLMWGALSDERRGL